MNKCKYEHSWIYMEEIDSAKCINCEKIQPLKFDENKGGYDVA